MRKRFVVGVDSMSDEQEQKFLEYIRKNGYGWWHWLNNFWLIVDGEGKLTASQLRDTLKSIVPNVNLLVIDVEGKQNWSGFGPRSEERNMFNWIRKTWDRD